MKKKLISIVLLISLSTIIYSQKINNTNYYDYQIIGNTDWLRPCDAVPIIIDELSKNDINYSTIGVGDLCNINDSTKMILTVSFRINDKKCGFIYEGGHWGIVDVSQRDFMTNSTKCSCSQLIERKNNTKTEYIFRENAPLPSNIFLLKETCYWHQTYPDGTNAPVSKKVAIAILRQDIRLYLKKI